MIPDLPPAPEARRIWVALSGGRDSTVLLHALRARDTPGLRAVHVHHGLQPAADDWLRWVRTLCRDWGIALTVRRVRVEAGHPDGPEAAARHARYAAFQALLRTDDLLATAHHADDQAETVLLRALRGTGISGLAAMAPLAPLSRGRIWRPMLAIPGAAIAAYAQAQALRWVEDPHNRDPRFARSWLRSEVLPRLAAHFPQAPRSLVRLAGRAAEAAKLLDELAVADLSAAELGAAWSVSRLMALSPARRRNALRYAWQLRYPLPPSEAQLVRLEREVIGARVDATPSLRHARGSVRRYRDGLFFLPPLPPPPEARAWPRGTKRLPLGEGLGELLLSSAPPAGLRLRGIQAAERLRPISDSHTRSLKYLCQRHGLPPWIRERLPVLVRGDVVLSVGGYWHSEAASDLGIRCRWRTNLPGAEGLSRPIRADALSGPGASA